jgi:penicillin-binding protein 2
MKKKRSLGLGFKDELSNITARASHFKSQKDLEWKDALIPNYEPVVNLPNSSWRVAILFCISVLLFFTIFLRLFHLQIAKGSENRQLAEGNRIQVKRIHAPRGVIYDRNGKILASNNPGFRLVEGPASPAKRGEEKSSYISRDEAIKMEVSGDPKFANLEIDNLRDYPFKEITSHVLGYISEVTAEELEDLKDQDYHPGDRIGRGGVEQTYEKDLRGVDGGEVIEVDSKGVKVRTLRTVDPIPGKSLHLSLDIDLQKIAFAKLQETVLKTGSCCGAVIAEDPETGGILALVSFPSYDPSNVAESLTAPNSPMLNRSLAGVYPPGSVFKVASSLAGLSSGKITPETSYEDTGVISLGPFTFANWFFTEYGKTEGSVNMIKALQRSNDIYFYRLGMAVGEEAIADAAKKLGMGQKSNIDIPGEATGVIPTNAWKVENLGEVWFPGDTLHMAIGQGFVTVTPLEISNMIAAVASGRKITPHLNSKISQTETKVDFKKEDLEVIKRGLELVPINGGTAWPFFSFPVPTAGKTGTAEFGHPKNRTHAWYTAYAPIDEPKITVTVLVEAGGEGSTVASPIAKEIFRWFFSPDKSNLIKDSGAEASAAARILGE